MRWVKALGGLGLVTDDFSFLTDLPVENGDCRGGSRDFERTCVNKLSRLQEDE